MALQPLFIRGWKQLSAYEWPNIDKTCNDCVSVEVEMVYVRFHRVQFCKNISGHDLEEEYGDDDLEYFLTIEGSNMQEVKSRNGRILAVVTEGDQQVKKIADNVLEIPRTLNALVPLLSVVPLQLLAYYVAVYNGLDVDMPRNLAKSVTVE